ncbi:MAG: hypothetical protein KDC61_19180 [Saprospiraceae bacterium]|nr:hypothetical protein [Saprospiraceae bacterium]MCB0545683.1 hypothetical protein [Saprospiraceae bacterium]MCB0576690.1 hypothetical protein [Saprospiraceae bacterium]MCB9306429.1 hypothetical protein [Lewinellaceae bacterium]MCB9353633.1 hypothetical protein [Lewinellaceae bacterium]
MSTDERIRNRRSFKSPMLILGIAMTIFYIALGLWLFLDHSFLQGIPVEFRNIFAVMVLIYGVFRGWRVYADFF